MAWAASGRAHAITYSAPGAARLLILMMLQVGLGAAVPASDLPGWNYSDIFATQRSSTVLISDRSAEMQRQLEALSAIWQCLRCESEAHRWEDRNEFPWWAYRDKHGEIVEISLPRAACSGTVIASASKWSSLRGLRALELEYNDLHGALPEEWAELGSLQGLYLDNNRLSGQLPRSWGKLGGLLELTLNDNKLSGDLPAEWAEMGSLRTLDLGGNDMHGRLPAEFGRLTNLTRLDLQGNNLSGFLPMEWHSLGSSQFLNLHDNKLSGQLPPEWAELGSLQDLRLHYNRLRGKLPASWGKMGVLEQLHMDHNSLSGELPASWSSMGSLRFLDLSENELSGRLPGQWAMLRGLVTLNLELNELDGPLPPEWGHFDNLMFLYVGSNKLSGQLPAQWATLGSLQALHLNNNHLHGALPASLSRLSNLRQLLLHENRFTGHLPNFSEMKQLRFLLAHQNRFTGSLPRLASGANYSAVIVHGNRFHGHTTDIGNPASLDLLVALPGSYLTSSAKLSSIVSRAEPFIDKNGWSAIFQEPGPPRRLAALLAVVIAMWAWLRSQLPQAAYPRWPSVADSVLRESFQALQPALGWQTAFATILAIGYSFACPQFVEIWDFNRYAATYGKSEWIVFVVSMCTLVSTILLVPTLARLPRHPSETSRAKVGRIGKLRVWICVYASCLVSCGPSVLNVYVHCSPYVQPSVSALTPLLPVSAAVLQSCVLPMLLRWIARIDGVPLYKLQVLHGASSWALPLIVVVVFSSDCQGSWWWQLEECHERWSWRCEKRYFTERGLDKSFSECWNDRLLDVPAETGCRVRNSTHCMRQLLVSAESLCDTRWQDPASCTSNILHTLGPFVFEKMCFACLLQLALLLASLHSRLDVPWWTPLFSVRRETSDGVEVALIFDSPCMGISRRLMSVSSHFSPTKVLLRVSVSADLSFAWGFLYPLVAMAGFAHFLIEKWCYEKARNTLRFRQQSDDEVFQAPRYTMIFWYMVANILCALHVASVVPDEPSILHAAAALAVAVLSWIGGLLRSSGQVNF
eukprot:TRINITY_DN30086_c0_g1_i1.p1 TRINITY_DN30086_c0_g1~~TRINITY_DN30086_c0_g1_i1.p1  ORF type:complete len:1050 (-),score=85.03 TRINITY_DN30086_c0_g1_i1:324-3422(-)